MNRDFFPHPRFRIFPWRTFSRVMLAQTALVVLILGAFALAARTLFQRALESANVAPEPSLQALATLDRLLLTYGIVSLLSLALFAIFASRTMAFPLVRLLRKATSASDPRKGAPEPLPGFLLESEDTEWTELETAVDRIRTDLQQKTDLLSREREELATLMSAISDAIIAVNLEGQPLFFNSRFALSFLEQPLTGRPPHLNEIFRSPEVLQSFNKALREGNPREISLPLYVRGEEPPRYFSLSIAPLRREEGPVYGAVGIFHDVTELKRAETIRIEFVANVSHELRTPLTAIKGYAETLNEDVAARRPDVLELAPQYLKVISRNVERLMSLINDLLDLSSLESGESSHPLAKTPIAVRDLTERVLAQLESRRSALRHRIEAECQAAQVTADPARIEQVLVNLLENALKYIPAGGLIRVSWEKEPDAVILKVSDNGPGILKEHHARLFERFYRVDKARSREQGGTGLGLAIVKHIMQRHGGSVWLESEPGAGTTFFCRFPD